MRFLIAIRFTLHALVLCPFQSLMLSCSQCMTLRTKHYDSDSFGYFQQCCWHQWRRFSSVKAEQQYSLSQLHLWQLFYPLARYGNVHDHSVWLFQSCLSSTTNDNVGLKAVS